MHRVTLNELRLELSVIPVAPLLIASGSEGRFIRTLHPREGTLTVYLPGAALKGALRSAARQVMSAASVSCCEPAAPCSEWDSVKHAADSAAVYRASCPLCRIFGSRALSSHLSISNAFPAAALDELEFIDLPDDNGHCESVQGDAFSAVLTLQNFECWQIGLLDALLTRINAGFETLGANRSLGMGRVMIRYTAAMITYFGFYDEAIQAAFETRLHGVGQLAPDAERYGLVDSGADDQPDLPYGVELNAGFGFTDVVVGGSARTLHSTIHKLLERQTPAWERFKRSSQP